MDAKIIEKLKEAKRYLSGQYNVSRLGVFGSYARGEERDGSDMDILIEFSMTPDLFEFFEIEDYLESVVGAKIDLARERALKRQIKNEALREVIYI